MVTARECLVIRLERETPADMLAAIAALPLEADDEVFSGRDDDKILYGKKGAR